MSYPGVDPSDTSAASSVDVQEPVVPVANPIPASVEHPATGTTSVPPAFVPASGAGQAIPPVVEVSNPSTSSAGLAPSAPVASNVAFEAAVQKAVKDMFEVTDAWAPKHVVKFKVELPSGQTVLLKHLDVMDLLEAGLLEEMDSFTKKLFPARLDDQGNPVDPDADEDTSIWAALRTPEKREKFFAMTGRLMALAAVKPEIIYDGVAIKGEGEDKTVVFGHQVSNIVEQVDLFNKPVPPVNSGQVYAGYIGVVDRLAIFQELNKPLALIEPFREGSAEMLQDLARSEGNGGSA